MKRIQSFIDSRPTNISGYIFTVDGKTITNAAVNKVLRKACANLNIKRDNYSLAKTQFLFYTHTSWLFNTIYIKTFRTFQPSHDTIHLLPPTSRNLRA